MRFAQYDITCKLSWVENEIFDVAQFRYMLTQYHGTIWAEIKMLVDEGIIDDVRNIEMKGTKNRLIELNFTKLYDNVLNKSYFKGPYKLMVYSYKMEDTNSQITAGYKKQSLVTFRCIDEVYYKMTLDQKSTSYSNMKISDVVKKIVSKNGGIIDNNLIKETDISKTWCEETINDFKTIKGLLPYSKSTNGETLYTFFMLNNKAYFAPITSGTTSEIKLNTSDIMNKSMQINNDHYQRLIDLYGNKDKVKITSFGYINDKIIRPNPSKISFFSENAKNASSSVGDAETMIISCSDDDDIKQNYIDNLYSRAHVFRKIVNIKTIAIPDLTPLNSIEILPGENKNIGNSNIYNGVYSIISVEYIYNNTYNTDQFPIMNLVLCTDTEDKGQEKTSGQSVITASTANVSETAATANVSDSILTAEEQTKWDALANSVKDKELDTEKWEKLKDYKSSLNSNNDEEKQDWR